MVHIWEKFPKCVEKQISGVGLTSFVKFFSLLPHMEVKHLLREMFEGICLTIDKITYFLLTLLLDTDVPFLIKLAKQK